MKELKTDDRFFSGCVLPFFGFSEGSTEKNCLVREEPGVSGTLKEPNSHSDPT